MARHGNGHQRPSRAATSSRPSSRGARTRPTKPWPDAMRSEPLPPLREPVTGKPRLDVAETLRGKHILLIGATGFVGKVALSMLLHRYPDVGKRVLPRAPGRRQHRRRAVLPEGRDERGLRSRPRGARRRLRGVPALEDRRARRRHRPAALQLHRRDVRRDRAGGSTSSSTAPAWCRSRRRSRARCASTRSARRTCSTSRASSARGSSTSRPATSRAAATATCGRTSRSSATSRARARSRATGAAKTSCSIATSIRRPRSPTASASSIRSRERSNDRQHISRVPRARAPRRCAQQRRDPDDENDLKLAVARERKMWMNDVLTKLGMERARHWGWTNTYTYTKSLGEQIILARPRRCRRRSCARRSSRARCAIRSRAGTRASTRPRR